MTMGPDTDPLMILVDHPAPGTPHRSRPPMDAGDIVMAITDGHYDKSIQMLIDAMVSRKRYLSEVKAARLRATIDIGDEVKFQFGVKPKYLANVVGKVTEVRGMKAVVDIGQGRGRFQGGVIVAPFAVLDLVRKAK